MFYFYVFSIIIAWIAAALDAIPVWVFGGAFTVIIISWIAITLMWAMERAQLAASLGILKKSYSKDIQDQMK